MKATHNFELTLTELEKYIKMPIQNERDRAGIIQAFEFTFEQSWKSIQKVAQSYGVEVASPKAAFTFALQNKWINLEDETKWLQLLKDRNLTTHTYHEDVAQSVLLRIQADYLSMFKGLLAQLKDAENLKLI